MRILDNGVYRDATPEELEAFEEDTARAAATERHRPLSAEEITRMLLAQQINNLALDDAMALRSREFYPEWEALIGQTVEQSGYKFQYNGDLYKTIPGNHTFAVQWIPGVGTESLYTRIDEVHDGSKYDPIPYDGNMALFGGLHYTQDGILYLCIRDTGQPVYNAMEALVELYVEVVP